MTRPDLAPGMTVSYLCPRRGFIRYGTLVKVTPRYAHITAHHTSRNLRAPIHTVKPYVRPSERNTAS